MFNHKFGSILKHPGYNDIGGAIGGIAGGILGMGAAGEQSEAASDAAAQSAAASKYATDLQRQIYEQTRADQEPWRQAGASGVNKLADLLGLDVTTQQGGGLSQQQLQNQYDAALTAYNDLVKSQSAPLDQRYVRDYSMGTGVAGLALNRLFGQQGGNAAAIASAKANLDALRAQLSQYGQGTGRTQQRSDQFGSLLKPFSMADYEADPGYQFRLSEGMKALDRSAAARGGLLSGATLKGAQRFGQGLASDEYQNAFNRYQTNQGNIYNRLAGISGVGQTATQALQQAGQSYGAGAGNLAMSNAANQGNALLAAGQARASAYQGLGGALGGLFGGSRSSVPGYAGGMIDVGRAYGFGDSTLNPANWG